MIKIHEHQDNIDELTDNGPICRTCQTSVYWDGVFEGKWMEEVQS